VLALTSGAPPLAADENAPVIALSEFTFLDTSGEPQDQTPRHKARLASFNSTLRSDIAGGNKYRVMALQCDGNSCSSEQDASTLAIKARSTGARYLLLGGIHKMSTLVGWAKAQMIDLRNDKVVFDKLLSFRGDTDEAWRRAEEFLARDIGAADLAK
jgi:hypothetical protein